jgi:predicted phosphodiesterase
MIIGQMTDIHAGGNTEEMLKKFSSQSFPSVDVLVLTGDFASESVLMQGEYYQALKFARDCFPSIPVVSVDGNHDFWEKNFSNFSYLEERKAEVRKIFNIHSVAMDGAKVIDDVLFCGIDGWYEEMSNKTRDNQFLPYFIEGKKAQDFMYHRMVNQLNSCLDALDTEASKKVFLSHFPLSEHCGSDKEHSAPFEFWQHIEDKVDVYFWGHTHKPVNKKVNNTHFYNVGGGKLMLGVIEI